MAHPDPWRHHGAGPSLTRGELRLRGPEPADTERAIGWWSDDAVCYGFQTEPSLAAEMAGVWRETLPEARERGDPEVRWVIEHRGCPIGLLWLTLWALERGDADLSILIGDPDRRRMGIGPQAIRLAAAWSFERLGVSRLWICPRADHAAAIAAYRSVGCVEDGLEPRPQEWRGEEVWTLRMVLTAEGMRAAAPRPSLGARGRTRRLRRQR